MFSPYFLIILKTEEHIYKMKYYQQNKTDEDELELSEKTLKEIQRAREYIKKGKYLTLEKAKKR